MGEDVSLRQEIEDVLGRQYRGSTNVYHPLTVFSQPEVKRKIKRAVANRLKGLRVVCYYGCYLVRPPATTHLDDPENPILMDELIGMTGAEVLDWSWKVDCCGGVSSAWAIAVRNRWPVNQDNLTESTYPFPVFGSRSRF